MENELKRCPFCGGYALYRKHDEGIERTSYLFFVECQDCFATTPYFYDGQKAIEAWNRRVEDSVDGVRCKVCYWYDKQERTCLLYNEDERKENQ